ncbi:hypothetical protein FUA48_16080 [Flavobacterium alkalisoli]|uniref:Phage late control D family protein n=1 Tax=Flavobacterium alkalisoli TaxID=2602769 RepID=A0A5B9FXG5_9FLAO|nr:hypothetical protein [Flavobacterium alkalisoli]QEE51039.1 hypothetical protein FUA48_16080 [Flavobacterium alkalisoli]
MNYLFYNMTCEVTIGNVRFDRVNNIHIEQSIKNQTKTAKIILPREYNSAIVNGSVESIARKNITEFIKAGDAVSIKLGYDGDNEEEFSGVVSSIGADIPLEIDCEDEMWHLKRTSYTKVFPNVTLLQLLKYIAPGYTYNVIDDINLGKFTLSNASAYKILEGLKSSYGLHSYFKSGVLTVGFMIDVAPIAVHQVNINRNVRANEANELKFLRKEDIRVLLKGISLNRKGGRLTYDFGDKLGAVRTLHFTNKTLDELKNLTEKTYKSLSFDGYRGSIPTWGVPRTKPGDGVFITDPNYENSERAGKYLIEAVTIDFNGNDGFKRTNTLGMKL